MKNSRKLAFITLAGCLVLLASVRASAQGVTGFTDVSYDDSTNTVTAYAETDADYDLWCDYEAYVYLSVTDDSGNVLAYGSHRDIEGYGYASIMFQFAGSPDTTYSGVGTHRLYANLYDDYWDYDYYPYRHIYDYYDDWYFSYFEGMGIDYPWYYYFYSPGYTYFTRRSRLISVGTTHSYDSATTPGVQIQITPSQTVRDGETASLSVTVTGDTPSAYQWSFKAPSGSGNSPKVTFSDPNNSSTNVASAHWFANPNDPCSASHTAPYTISCVVTLSSGKKKTVKTTLTVDAYWRSDGLGGETLPPNFSGFPAIAFDSSRNVFYVSGSGNIARGTPPQTIYVGSSSQFYDKIVRHENVHVQQYVSGSASDLFTVSGLMAVLSPLTDSTQAGLVAQINQATLNYYADQNNQVRARQPQLEKEAYAVSDAIAPQYVYQNCGRY